MTVTQRQHLLAYLGYYVGTVDGDWGTLSRTACKAFQRDFGGLEADGFGGPETDKALKHAVSMGFLRREPVTTQKPTTETFWDEIEFFTREEFACKCGLYHTPYCDGYPHEIQPLLVQIADRGRRHFGKPMTIISGLRCQQHNADSDGHVNSQHMYGEAADVTVQGESQQTVLDWFLNQPDVRYAYAIEGSSNVHFDIEPVER